MKRIGGLFDQIHSRDALVAAFYRAAKGKRSRPEVVAFLNTFDEEMERMSRELREGTHCFDAYDAFSVRDTKTREIHAPSFRDRTVHHAIIGATGGVFERGAMAHSYACRSGKGHHAALRQAGEWTRRSGWWLKIDVTKFYDSVDQEILGRVLERRFRERRLLALFDTLLASYRTREGLGLPIGALTSQYLGNFFLDEVDRSLLVKAAGRARLMRYMDDFLLFGAKDLLLDLRETAGETLAGMGLTMKHGGAIGRCGDGVPWLGFTLYPDRVRLNREGKRRLGRRWRGLERSFARGRIDEVGIQVRATSLFAHACVGDDVAWRRAMLGRGRPGEFREVPERRHESRDARRLVEQHAAEVPLGLPQQEEADEPQPEPGLPPGAVAVRAPWHGGAGAPPDDAPSGARAPSGLWDESKDKTPAGSEIGLAGTADTSGEGARRGTEGESRKEGVGE